MDRLVCANFGCVKFSKKLTSKTDKPINEYFGTAIVIFLTTYLNIYIFAIVI